MHHPAKTAEIDKYLMKLSGTTPYGTWNCVHLGELKHKILFICLYFYIKVANILIRIKY